MARFSDRVTSILRSVGWHEGRQVDCATAAAFLRKNGCVISPVAHEFLSEFIGLSLSLPNGGLTAAHFDVFEEMTYFEGNDREYLESLVGESLCPIGWGGRFLFLIAPTGAVVFLHDEWLLFLRAKTVSDAFECICFRDFEDIETVMLTEERKLLGFRDFHVGGQL